MQESSVGMQSIFRTDNRSDTLGPRVLRFCEVLQGKMWRHFSKSKGKGKEPASGSADPPPKRNRRNVIIEDFDLDPMEEETEQIPKPQ
ncbi:hypothetical protein L1987_15865 [Smallanthus sonchifolius]|uniref:Uncharacterized protein n=1 Tax=Smallanthus sonchifolius TaxID=185202 RepID=A0ACB9J6N6_9ASTR|nr:hypothetical protein L1987_15865 [Smallanthus sonchifolius]